MTEDRDAAQEGKKKMIWIAVVVGLVVVGLIVFFTVGGLRQRGGTIEPTGAPATAETNIYPGMEVQIQHSSGWYKGYVVTARPDGKVSVHYDQWDSRYDEDVPRSRLRIPPAP